MEPQHTRLVITCQDALLHKCFTIGSFSNLFLEWILHLLKVLTHSWLYWFASINVSILSVSSYLPKMWCSTSSSRVGRWSILWRRVSWIRALESSSRCCWRAGATLGSVSDMTSKGNKKMNAGHHGLAYLHILHVTHTHTLWECFYRQVLVHQDVASKSYQVVGYSQPCWDQWQLYEWDRIELTLKWTKREACGYVLIFMEKDVKW